MHPQIAKPAREGDFCVASFLSWVIDSLNQDKNIDVVDDQFNNPVWVNDFSNIIDLVITNNIEGLFHVGSNKIYSRYEFAIMIAKIVAPCLLRNHVRGFPVI